VAALAGPGSGTAFQSVLQARGRRAGAPPFDLKITKRFFKALGPVSQKIGPQAVVDFWAAKQVFVDFGRKPAAPISAEASTK